MSFDNIQNPLIGKSFDESQISFFFLSALIFILLSYLFVNLKTLQLGMFSIPRSNYILTTRAEDGV